MPRHSTTAAAAVAIIAGLQTGPAHAYTEAANYVAREQAAIGCNGEPGVFTQLWETDITGDGKKDMILDHANLACSSGSGSANCGASGACEIIVYVRKGGLLVETPIPENVVSIDKLSEARLSLHIGSPVKTKTRIVRWNGSRFK